MPLLSGVSPACTHSQVQQPGSQRASCNLTACLQQAAARLACQICLLQDDPCLQGVFLDSEGYVAEGPTANIGIITHDNEMVVSLQGAPSSACPSGVTAVRPSGVGSMQLRYRRCFRASILHWANNAFGMMPPSLHADTPMAALQVPPEDTTLRGVTMERLIEVVPQVSLRWPGLPFWLACWWMVRQQYRAPPCKCATGSDPSQPR